LWLAAQEMTMNRDRLLMFAALAIACAGFTLLNQPALAGHDDLLLRIADLGQALSR
jgi:hypothetical protein